MGRIICNKSLRLCSKPQMKRSFWKFMLFQWFLGFVSLKSGGFLISCRFFHKPVRREGLRQSVSLFSLHIRQYRTKSVWRLCTPSACKIPFRACFVSSRTHLACIFSEIFRENTRKSTKDFLRFSLHLSKNLTTQSAYVRYETDSHISQKCSWIHQVFTPLFVSSDEKFDDASVAQSLCGVALRLFGKFCCILR